VRAIDTREAAGAGGLGRTWRRGWLVIAVVAALTGGLWVGLISAVSHHKFGGDPRGMLFLGRSIYHPKAFDGIPRCGRWGYDGQFYAALATDPFLRSPEMLKALDAPGLRAGRILLPLAAWVAGFGNARVAIVAYQVLGWSLGVAAVVLAAMWLRSQGRSPWWVALLAVNAGLVTAIFRSTLDGATTCLIVATLLLHRRARHRAGVTAATLAALARDTGVIAGLACAGEELLRGNVRRSLRYLLVPLAFQLAWQAYLQLVWRPNVRFTSALSIPFVALARKLVGIAHAGELLRSQEVWAVVGAALTVVAAAAVLVRGPRTDAVRLAFVAFGLLAACLSANQYIEAYNSTRVVMAAPFLAVVLSGDERGKWMKALLLSGPLAFAWSGVLMIVGELGLR
jgi:hypothetical protein